MTSPGHEPESKQVLEAQLRATLDVIPAYTWYAAPSGGLTFVNKRHADYLGLPKDHPLRLGIDIGASWDSHIPLLHPDDHEQARRVWSTCLSAGHAGEMSFRLRNAEGVHRWFLTRAEPLRATDGTLLYWIGVNLEIDELKQAEFYLAEGQRLAHMGSWAFDPDRFCYWSPELFRMYGLDPASKPPSVQEYLDRVHPHDRESMANLIKGILANGSPFDATKRIVRPDGEVRYIRCVGAPVAENQDLKKYVGSAMDVTEHELLTQELGRREAYLTEAQRLSHTGSFGWRPDTGEIVWSEETYRIFEYNSAEKPTVDMVLQRTHPQDRALVKQVIESVSKSGTDFELEFRLLLPDGRVKHLQAIAHAVRDAFGEREFVGGVTDITERKTTEDKIRRLVEADILGIFIAKVKGEIVYANQAFLQMLQYGRQDLVSGRLRWTDLTPAELRVRDERALTEALATGVFQLYEKEFLRKDGSRLPVLIGGALFQSADEGVVFVLDLSKQKRAEEALRSSEAYLAEAQRLSKTGSFTWRPTADTTYFSKECYRVLGFEPQGAPPPPFETIMQRIHPDDQGRCRELVEKSIRDKVDVELDYRIVHPDKRVRDIHCVGHVVLDRSGELVEIVGTVIDITERNRAEEALRTSQAYLAEAQRLSKTGSWAWSAATGGPSYWSEECYRVLGFDPIDGLPQGEDFFQRIHPDDRPGFRELAETSIREKAEWQADYRIVHPDGRVRDIHVIAHPVLSTSGELVEFVGTVIDVTERKRAEEERRRSEMELRQIVDLVPQLIAVYGPNRERLYANRTALDYLGISLDEWRHKPFAASAHPDDSERLKTYTDRALSSGAADELELRLRKHDASYRWFLAHFKPLLDENGKIIRWYYTGTDIDDRKQAEDKLREENVALKRAEEKIRGQEAELRQILDLAPQHIAVYGSNRERLYANHVKLDYLGSSLEEWQQSPGRGKYFHPDDIGRIDGFFDRTLARASADELELRLRKRDGSYRWFLARLNPLCDDQGQIKRWYIVYTDIEDRKRAEERLQRENVALREEIDKASMFEEIVGTSPALKAVLLRISKVAPSDSTVLITGETGTGKELVARAIHRRSDRSSLAFVSVNCAAIPRELIASELFGHEKGAFTGASQQRLGRFELASGGTLFLDEVGELPHETQIALLRVLQEHEFERVGGTRRIRADVRVIAATNRELQAAISAGFFRRDLFYRLNVFPIEIPPLRERKEDIRLLVEYFIDRYARKAGKNITSVDKKTLRLLESYPWPGNIRELQNVIERSVIVSETTSFSVDESWLFQQPPERKAEGEVYLSEKVAAQEKEIIEAALRECQGRVFGPKGAATKLGIPRSTLESKIRTLKIDKNRFKTGAGAAD
jgi:PAS domain S-box-containing protein